VSRGAYYYIKKQEKMTGVRIPIESERGKMRINTEQIECDLLKFDKLIEAGKNENAEDNAAQTEKAAELYQGLPFEENYYPWASIIQGYYEYRYMELLDSLVLYYRKNHNEKKAKYYEEKLKTD